MAITPNRFTPDIGTLEIQQTAALQLVSSGLTLADNDTWVDITKFVKRLDPGAPAARGSSDEYNASSRLAMSSRSNIVPKWTPVLTIYDTNGVASDVGLTADNELVQDFFRPALENGLELPFRFSYVGGTGKPLYTYTNCEVMRIGEPILEPGTTSSAVREIAFEAETRTESVVS